MAHKFRAFLLAELLMLGGCAYSSNDQNTGSIENKSEQKEKNVSKSVVNSESIEDQNLNAAEEFEPPVKNSLDDQTDSTTSSDSNEPLENSESFIQSIRLDVPQKMQETGFYCAVACLQMVLEYHGIAAEQNELASALHTDPVTGTEYEDLARVASVYRFGKEPQNWDEAGYRAVIWNQNQGSQDLRNQFESQAMQDLSNNDPLFVSINIAQLYGYHTDASHELVIYGVDLDENGHIQTFYCIDPSYLFQDTVYGGKKSISADELWTAMNNNPEPGYVW